jgi:integrase
MSTAQSTRIPDRVEVHHRKACRMHSGGRCNCTPSYRAKVKPRGCPRIVSPRFPSWQAADNWMTDRLAEVNRGTYVAPTRLTLAEAAAEFIEGARAGHILNRNGERYMPSVVRDYEGDLRRHVLPTLGDMRLHEIRRGDLQRLIDTLVKRELAGSTVRNALDPARRIFDRAVKRDVIPYSPCQNLEVPRGDGRRDRVAQPAEAAELIAALPDSERALWATAFYAGLRRSELRALRCNDLDLEAGTISVSRSWDDEEGEQDRGKSKAARRTVALIAELKPELVRHLMATGRRGADLVFGRSADEPFIPSTVRSRAWRAWGWKVSYDSKRRPAKTWVKVREDALEPIGLHEARHTFGSVLAAAGVDVNERQRQMGHESSAMMDRYTHGFDGSVAKAGEQVQRWLDAQRVAG